MHVKLTYRGDGTIDIDASDLCRTGSDVSRLLDALKKACGSLVVERLNPAGAPIQDPEVLR